MTLWKGLFVTSSTFIFNAYIQWCISTYTFGLRACRRFLWVLRLPCRCECECEWLFVSIFQPLDFSISIHPSIHFTMWNVCLSSSERWKYLLHPVHINAALISCVYFDGKHFDPGTCESSTWGHLRVSRVSEFMETSSSSVPHCIVSHQCLLISCFDPVCLHVPAVDGDDDRCFKWHFSANNLLSYWFPAQISCSALFPQMDFVPLLSFSPPIFFSHASVFDRISNTDFQDLFFPFYTPYSSSPRLNSSTN